MEKKFYITTPIYYVNDSPHIGHTYTTLACDFLARFKRLDGYKTYFLTGTDEHGQKVEKSARSMDLAPQAFTDIVSGRFRTLCETMNFSNDDFIRTTEARHKDVVAEIWKKMQDAGYIYMGKYCGWYSVRDEAFFDESEIVDGKAPTGAEVEWVEESSYFFKLSAMQEELLKLYEAHPKFIQPESKRNEVIAFVKSGLKDLSISRTSFKWGIKVPGDEDHVIYVWLDALFNYYSAVKDKGMWPADLHVVGKDILRFHAVYWPAFLMAVDLPLPHKVFAHGWWTIEGQKMSKSIGNVISPDELLKTYGLDYSRYFLMREMPFGNDGDFSKKSLAQKVNAELCNNIGNLSQRVLAFIQKNGESKVPTPAEYTTEDTTLLEYAYSVIEKMRVLVDKQEIHAALGEIVKLGSKANEYIDKNAPWNLRKTDTERMNTVLYLLLEIIRTIGILLQPIVPDSAAKLLDSISVEDRSFKALNQEHKIAPGTILPIPHPIFPRVEVE